MLRKSWLTKAFDAPLLGSRFLYSERWCAEENDIGTPGMRAKAQRSNHLKPPSPPCQRCQHRQSATHEVPVPSFHPGAGLRASSAPTVLHFRGTQGWFDSIISRCAAASKVAAQMELILERLDGTKWTASLINHGDSPVVAVLPGDGSSHGWRTPIVAWEVASETGPLPPFGDGRSCGMINPVCQSEVVSLQSGESVCLDAYRLLAPHLPESGLASVRLMYRSAPDLLWTGIPLGAHDPMIM